MPLINTSVPNLIQGVSQQADTTRFAGQCEEQINAISSVAEGLKKRPNTKHIAKLITSAIGNESFVHFINRSSSEKYVIILTGTTLRAFNLQTGVQCSINGDPSYATSTGYLHSANTTNPPFTFNPRKDIKALTVADNTFLLNTKKNVLQNSTNKTDPVTNSAVVTITQGDYGKSYQVTAVRRFGAATVSVEIESIGTKYRHKFTWTNRRYSYHHDRTGALDFAHIYKVYPKGFSPNHPSALRAEIGITQSDYNSNTNIQSDINSRQIDTTSNAYTGRVFRIAKISDGNLLTGSTTGTYQGYIDLDEEFTEWVVENPRAITNMGNFDITSGGSNASHHSSTSAIAAKLILPATQADGTATTGYNNDFATNTNQLYVDFSLPSFRQAMDANFTVTRQGSSIVFSDIPKLGDYFNSVDYQQSVVIDGGSGFLSQMQSGDTVEFFVKDGLAGAGISVAHKQTDSISSLPAKCLNNFKIKVIGDTELAEDDYYVKFITNSGDNFGDGAFVETSGSEINQQIESTTFLHRLVNTAEDEFVLKSVDPAARNAGDDISNPFPSFVYDGVEGVAEDFRIQNLFFYKNRLGLLSRDNVIMSEAGQPFNFFRTTTLSLLDSAPIDVSVASNRVVNLKSAIGFQENLVLFSEGGQFVLKNTGILSPKTVSISPITNFNFESEVEPIALGSYIYFPFARGAYTGVREFTVDASSETYKADEITEHVPAYIPKNVVDITATTAEDMIVLLSGDDTDSLYVYKYFWNNNQKILSSWSKFKFGGQFIKAIKIIESILYMVVTTNNETLLYEMSLADGANDLKNDGSDAGFIAYADKRVPVKIDANYSSIQFKNSSGNWSTAAADRPYALLNGAPSSFKFVEENGHTSENITITNSAVYLTSGNTTSSDRYGWMGNPYATQYKFSTQVFKAQSGNSASPSASTEMAVRNGVIFFDDTSMFDVKVTPSGRSETTASFYASTRPDSTLPAPNATGVFSIASGSFRFPIYCKAKHASIVLENGSVHASNFNSAEFESFVHPRSKRYG